MKTLNIGLTAVLVLSLAGCSWLGLRDRGNDYLLAEETEPTVIPAEMQVDRAAALGQLYPIPLIPTTSVEAEGFEVPRPQPASVNTFEQLVKIQTVDGRRWVLINISPSESWPRVRNLLNRNGIPSALAEGSTGIIETVWVTLILTKKIVIDSVSLSRPEYRLIAPRYPRCTRKWPVDQKRARYGQTCPTATAVNRIC